MNIKSVEETSALYENSEKPHLPGFVVLGKKSGHNHYHAIIERSFSMDLSSECCHFFWTGKGHSFLGTIDIDGYTDAKQMKDRFEEWRPDFKFEIWDVHDENLPINIDWDGWREACEPADTFSGVKNKFDARNPKFVMKG